MKETCKEPTFGELLTGVRKKPYIAPVSLIAVDPGETVGFAWFRKGDLRHAGQTSWRELPDEDTIKTLGLFFQRLLINYEPVHVVIEDYKIYEHKSKMHSWSDLITPRLIGAMQIICHLREIPLTMQMASSKQFCTNGKLRHWGYYKEGMPHANDAIRHGCYWLLFHKRG